MPNLCYWCGCLNHNDKDCSIWINSKGTLCDESKQFGPSLQALPFFSLRKHVAMVLGFYKNARISSTVAPEEMASEGGPLRHQMEMALDKEAITMIENVTPGDILISNMNTFSKTYPVVNS